MKSLLTKGIWLAFAFATLVLLSGIALVAMGAAGDSEFEIFGQKLKSASVGIAAVALAVVSFVVLVRRVLHSYDKLDKKERAGTSEPVSHSRVVAGPEIRETMGRLGEKIELVLSALRSPGTAKTEVENLHEQLEGYINAHSLFLNQDIYPTLSSFKDTLHDAVNMRISRTYDAQALSVLVSKLIKLRNETMSKLAEMASHQPVVKSTSVWWIVAIAVLVGALVLISVLLSARHDDAHAVAANPTPVIVEVRMPERERLDAGTPIDAGPQTRLRVVAIPRGRIWIDGHHVGEWRVTKSVLPGRHMVAIGSDSPTVSQIVHVSLGETRYVELAVRRW